MKHILLTGVAMLTVATGFAQNSVSISQSGGAGNSASVTQSGEGNQITISQAGSTSAQSNGPGNRVSLRVPKGTQTTIDQQNEGPNQVEISQDGLSTAVIRQSSATGRNTVVPHPESSLKSTQSPPTPKRRGKRS